jgi:hypothetical protein
LLSCGDLTADGAFEPRLELSQYLLVARADGGKRGARGARPRFEVQHQVEQDLLRARIARGRLVDELLPSRLVIFRRRPSSVIVTGSFSVLSDFLVWAAARAGCRTGPS